MVLSEKTGNMLSMFFARMGRCCCRESWCNSTLDWLDEHSMGSYGDPIMKMSTAEGIGFSHGIAFM